MTEMQSAEMPTLMARCSIEHIWFLIVQNNSQGHSLLVSVLDDVLHPADQSRTQGQWLTKEKD